MNIEDIYYDFPQLMTPEEKEDMNHSDCGSPSAVPRWLTDLTMDLPLPEEEDRAEFLQRSPALGLTSSQIQKLRQHSSSPRLTHPQEAPFLQLPSRKADPPTRLHRRLPHHGRVIGCIASRNR